MTGNTWEQDVGADWERASAPRGRQMRRIGGNSMRLTRNNRPDWGQRTPVSFVRIEGARRSAPRVTDIAMDHPLRTRPSQFASHSLWSAVVRRCPPERIHAGQERCRSRVNTGSQTSKACEGLRPPRVQIPPPPLLAGQTPGRSVMDPARRSSSRGSAGLRRCSRQARSRSFGARSVGVGAAPITGLFRHGSTSFCDWYQSGQRKIENFNRRTGLLYRELVRVERHWWNGNRGLAGRRDVYVRTDGERWEVEAQAGGAGGRSKIQQCPGEASALILADAWLGGRPEWRLLPS